MRHGAAAVASLLALLALALAAPAAQADHPTVFGSVGCTPQPGEGNVRLCSGTTLTWDGATKIDVDVILPPAPASGPDGPYPLIGVFHGWGGEKIGLNEQTRGWAQSGYAVFSMSDRGWGKSCGASDLEKLLPVCAAGYNHLLDDRYEVRDAQYLISVLADEGVAEPKKIGATGVSYGGGMSMALAALRNRTMMPDGSLVPWQSPKGKSMELAAAVPQWPWSDLAYSLMPNGRTLDYVADAPYRGPDGTAPIGIEKQSFVTGLFGTGAAESNYAPPETDPDADLTTWYAAINAGEPYDSNPLTAEILAEITAHHSSYYIDHSQPPAPLLIQSGWNDDLFPPDEAIRFYNRTRSQYPGDPISLFFMDDGHQRSQNKPADEATFRTRQNAWFDHYLKGTGAAPSSSVEALSTTCGEASAGPYRADSWRDLAPGEIRLDSAAAKTIVPGAGNPTAATAYDPIAGKGACATASGAEVAGTASYSLAPAPAEGFTLAGSPTVVADLEAPGGESQLAGRLLDVAPSGEATLVARGLLRPGTGGQRFVFQLHPQAWRFAFGHVAKLELLPGDAPYARAPNLQGPITVSNLELRLPVLEHPGALGGLVQEPAPKVIPPGYEAAIEYRGSTVPGGPAAPLAPGTGRVRLAKGGVRIGRGKLSVPLRCTGAGPCSGSLLARRGKRALARGGYALASGASKRVSFPLTKAGRRLVTSLASRHGKRPRVRLALADAGSPAPLVLKRPLRTNR